MKKYEIYKDSGFEWIGEIPEGWEVSRIKHLLEQSKDGIKIGPFGSALTGKVNNEGEYKVYGQWNIVGKDFNAGKNFVSSETFSALESYHISSGDLFISMMGTVGKCAIIPKGVAPGIMDSHVVKARLDETKMLPKYFEYVYDKDNSNVIYSQIQKYRKGSIMDGLNSTLIKEFVVPFPSLSEQRTIISYLDHKVGQIDASVSAINTQIDDLKAYRQSIISEAVTKGLNPDAKMKDSGVEWIGEIPEGWDCLPMKRGLTINNGKDYKEIQTETGYPVFGSGGRFAYALDYLYDGEAVLLGRKGTIDKPMYVNGKFWTVDTMFYAIPNKDVCCKYMYYQAQTIPFGLYSTNTALPSMTQTDLADNPMCFPPLPEQQAIASYLDKKTYQIDSSIASFEVQRDDLNALKQSIISEAVTGKIDLRDWKPKN